MQESKTSASIISQSVQLISVEFDVLFGPVDVMNLTLILYCPFSIQGR